jgi:SprT-like family
MVGILRAVVVRRVGLRDGMDGLRVRRQPGCLGRFSPPGQFYPARIQVLSPLGAEGERRVLLHEMIHCAIYFDGFKGERHGPRFVAEIERLAALGETWAAGEATRYAELEATSA